MRIRRAAAALALTATIAGGTAVLPTSAEAGTVPSGASAFSSGMYVAPGSGINASLGVTGAIGALVGPIVNPVLSQVTNTLVAALIGDGTPNNPGLLALLTSTLSQLTATQATTPSTQVTNPGTGFPSSCTTGGWTSSTCYSTSAWLGMGLMSPLINISSRSVSGYTNADPDGSNNNPMSAYASINNPVISLFGLPIAQLGLLTAKSVCPTTNSGAAATAATLSTTSSLGTVSLLGGLLSFSVASNGLLMVQVGSSTPVSISQLQTQVLSLAGLDVQVASTGTNALRITIQLGLANLLTSFGLGAIAGLTGLSGNTMALTATIGPGAATVSANGGSAKAVALDVKLGLSGTLGLNVMGLVGAGITVSPISGSADGDLLDMQVGYTSCASGTTTGGSTGGGTGGTTGGTGGTTGGTGGTTGGTGGTTGGTGGVWYPPGLI